MKFLEWFTVVLGTIDQILGMIPEIEVLHPLLAEPKLFEMCESYWHLFNGACGVVKKLQRPSLTFK